MDIDRVKLWIDRQLAGDIPNVIGAPGEKMQVVESDIGLVVVCAGGCYLVDANGEGQECDLETDGNG